VLFSFLISLYLPRVKPSNIFKPLQHEERSCQLLEHLLNTNNIRLSENKEEHKRLVGLVKAMIHPVGLFKTHSKKTCVLCNWHCHQTFRKD